MSEQATETAVRAEVIVEAPIERAFDAFVGEIGDWWDRDHHILEGELAEMVFEPRAGGHIIDRASDGSECRWARVLAYEPPTRVVFSWDINLEWKLESDLERTSEVEVSFATLDDRRTQVTLVHRNLDRHGAGWERMGAAVGSDEGWAAGMREFAAYAGG